MKQPAPLYIVGLGPGDASLLAPKALHALQQSACIAGYTRYIELLDPALLQGKTVISTGMMAEINRCQQAIAQAQSGVSTAVVCSGDAGIYALAGLIYELLEAEEKTSIPVEVIPGIPAFCAAAALLGAPLMHDFACISLSDLLTPWQLIEKRLHAAFSADFVTVLYNPRSRRRADYLANAQKIAQIYQKQTTPVGIVQNAYRNEQKVAIHTLETLDIHSVDMLSIVLIGNSETRFSSINKQSIITPRGYLKKYDTNQTLLPKKN